VTPPVDGSAGSGGNSPGGTGGQGAGGTGSTAGTECVEFDPDEGECGTCTLPLSYHCMTHDCTMPDDFDYCFDRSARFVVRKGDGYLRVEGWHGWAEETPVSVAIWNQATEDLVFFSARSAMDVPCTQSVVVGSEPDVSYGLVCDSGQVCPLPPHIECLGPCFYGCITQGQDCATLNAACEGGGGAGGEGGFGGDGP
jgi:hypothetical protein